MKIAVRVLANTVVVVGVFLLARILGKAAGGSLNIQAVTQSAGSWKATLYTLGLSLPIPFHVISIGLVMQRKWLPQRWAVAAWWAIVISGCWLGVALSIRLLLAAR